MDDESRKRGKELLNEFEGMRDMAELKALSKLSQERPLDDNEFRRIKSLGKSLGLVR